MELSISPGAVRSLKDANLLLKREGCSSDSSKQQQQLYDIEDSHLAYQHPRFCAFAIFVRSQQQQQQQQQQQRQQLRRKQQQVQQ